MFSIPFKGMIPSSYSFKLAISAPLAASYRHANRCALMLIGALWPRRHSGPGGDPTVPTGHVFKGDRIGMETNHGDQSQPVEMDSGYEDAKGSPEKGLET